MSPGRYYGIDIGGTTIKLGLFQGSTLQEKWEFPTDVSEGGRNILPDIVASLPGPADGAAIGVPGAVLPDGTGNRCVNLGWGVCRPSDSFTALTGIPCRVCNDANAAALGEQWQGSGAGLQDILLVTLGTGVGAGIVEDGELRYGAHGSAGELGHICVDPQETMPCSCGRYGCLEQYCSASGIVRMAKRAGLSIQTPKELFAMVAVSEETACTVADDVCSILGRGIAAACDLLDPEAVILGGGISQAGEALRSRVERAFQRHIFHACQDTKILLASLGNDAGLYGTARLAMEAGGTPGA